MDETAPGFAQTARSPSSSLEGFTRRVAAFVAEYWVTVAAALVALVVWEIYVKVMSVPRYLFPAPSAIGESLVRFQEILLNDTWVTLQEIFIGFLAGCLVGLLLSYAIVFSRLVEKIVYPPAILTQLVPKLAIAPLFIIWFGIGILPKVMIIVVVCMFPLLINSVTGMRSVDPRMLELMHSVNASRWQVFTKIQFPNAIPHVFAGLKIAITMSVTGAIVGEWLGSNAGLGHQILMANSQMRTDLLFAALCFLALVGMALFGLIVVLERLALPRRRKQVEIVNGI
jgi:NitT/TauT family transport system permease protein